MKNISITMCLCLAALCCKSQNLLNRSEDYIKQYFTHNGIDFQGTMYDYKGTPILHFSYSTSSANEDGLIASYYFLNERNTCKKVEMLYENTRYLEGIVTRIKSDTTLAKIPDSFAWIKKDASSGVSIEQKDNGSFILEYFNATSK